MIESDPFGKMRLMNLNTQGDRIRYVREEILRIRSQEELASRLGLKRGSVGNWELNKPISRKNLLALSKMAGVSAEWIASREGDDPKPRGQARDVSTVDGNGEKIDIPRDGIAEIDSRAGLGGGQEVPISYSRDEEGWHIVDAFKPDAWVFPSGFMKAGFRVPASKVIAITTQGESMAPTINHGDVVFVDTTHRRISPPGLYAIRDVYGEIIIKRIDVLRSGEDFVVRITSDNKHEPTRDEPLSEVYVVGRVCGMLKLV